MNTDYSQIAVGHCNSEAPGGYAPRGRGVKQAGPVAGRAKPNKKRIPVDRAKAAGRHL